MPTEIELLKQEIALLRAIVEAVQREDHAIELVQNHINGVNGLSRADKAKKKRAFPALVDQWDAAERDKEEALVALKEFDESRTV